MMIFASSRARWLGIALVLFVACALLATIWWRRTAIDPTLIAVVQRGTFRAELTTSGTLKPIDSLTYRSPVQGRELEIVDLVPEGTRVNENDVIVRLDSTELQRDVDRLRQELRQLQLDLQVAHIERQEAEGALKSASEGEGALSVEEARAALQLAEKKTARLRQEYDQLRPLMEKGFITREELARTLSELEEAEEDLRLVRKRTSVVVELTHPRETQRATLQLAQKNSHLEDVVGRVQEGEIKLQQMLALVEACTIRARRPGLVVYEQYLNASPRRKIRIGDRVSASQGLITIPEVNRMLVESTVTEAEVRRVKPGQSATVRLEAFPDLRLTGRVVRVGTLASTSIERPFDDKRFDLIIELDASHPELRPEMTARADIVTGQRENVLLVPVTAVFENQGRYVAHVPGRSGGEVRRIDVGESNGQFVEVVAGLRENERVLLTAPPNDASAPAAQKPANNATPVTVYGNAVQLR